MNCWLLHYKHKHLDYLQHITGHFLEKHKARSDKGDPTIKHNSRKRGTVYFMHIQWQTAQIISWSRKTVLLLQLTQVSPFHCSESTVPPSSSGTEQQVVQQQCPAFHLCSLHQVIFQSLHDSGKTKHFVFSLPLGLQSLCHLYKEMYFNSEMNDRQCWQADLQQGAGTENSFKGHGQCN